MYEFNENGRNQNSNAHMKKRMNQPNILKSMLNNQSYKKIDIKSIYSHYKQNLKQAQEKESKKHSIYKVRKSLFVKFNKKRVPIINAPRQRNSTPIPNSLMDSHQLHIDVLKHILKDQQIGNIMRIKERSKQKLLKSVEKINDQNMNKLPKLNISHINQAQLISNTIDHSIIHSKRSNNSICNSPKNDVKEQQIRSFSINLNNLLKNSLKIKKKLITQKNQSKQRIILKQIIEPNHRPVKKVKTQINQLPSKPKNEDKNMSEYKKCNPSFKQLNNRQIALCRWNQQELRESLSSTPNFDV